MSPRKKISLSLVLTLALSMFSYVPIVRAGTLSVNGGLFVLPMMWSPGLAGILTQLISARTLRGLGWRFGPRRWLVLAYLLPILYGLPVYLFTWLTGLGVFPNPVLLASDMVGPLILALGEEIGWRGLFVPELVKMTSFTKTAFISGIVWAAWHMPAIFLADYYGGGTRNWYAAIMFAVMIIAISFPFAWLRLKSGSLWPAVVLRASHHQLVVGIFDKLTGHTSATSYILGEFGFGLVLTSLVLAYVFWRRQRDGSLPTQSVTDQPVDQPESSGAV